MLTSTPSTASGLSPTGAQGRGSRQRVPLHAFPKPSRNQSWFRAAICGMLAIVSGEGRHHVRGGSQSLLRTVCVDASVEQPLTGRLTPMPQVRHARGRLPSWPRRAWRPSGSATRACTTCSGRAWVPWACIPWWLTQPTACPVSTPSRCPSCALLLHFCSPAGCSGSATRARIACCSLGSSGLQLVAGPTHRLPMANGAKGLPRL